MAPEGPAITERGGDVDEKRLIETAQRDPSRFADLYGAQLGADSQPPSDIS